MVEHEDDGSVPAAAGRRHGPGRLGWTAAALTVLLLVLVVGAVRSATGGDTPATAAGTAAATSSVPVSTTAAAAVTPSPTTETRPDTPTPTPTPTLAAAALAHEKRDIASTLVALPTRVSLTSPTAWDEYGPEGKPYPGASTEVDIATCPHISARLGAALGKELSYWVGTLPGEGGCRYATVPLSYDGPYDYAYQLDVAFLADGSAPADWRHHFYEDQGAICSDADAPAVAADAVLVGCTSDASDPSYVLLLPDARGAGLWMLSAEARSSAPRTAPTALAELVSAVQAVYR